MLNLERVLTETGEKEAKSVKKICLSNKEISIIGNLRTCLWVERIDLSKNDIDDAGGLGGCTGTKWLNLSQNRISSVEFMSSMLHMTVLNLGHNLLKDISAIGSLINLKALILNDNKIKNVVGLEKLRNLNTLVLSHNRLTEFDLSASLGGLVKLQLAHNKLMSFPNVKYNLELKNLLLNDNMITRVNADCVGSSNKLELVDLGRNKIENLEMISTLSCIPSIINLNLVGNPISRETDYVSKTMSLFRRLKTLDAMPVYKKVGELKKEKDPKVNADTVEKHSSSSKKRKQECLTSADEQEGAVEDNVNTTPKAMSSTKKKHKSNGNVSDELNDTNQPDDTTTHRDKCKGNITEPPKKPSEVVDREDGTGNRKKKKKRTGDIAATSEVQTDNSEQDNSIKKKKKKIFGHKVEEDWCIDRFGAKPIDEVDTKNRQQEKIHKKNITTFSVNNADNSDNKEIVLAERESMKNSALITDSHGEIYNKRTKGILPIKKNRQKTGVRKIVNVKSGIKLCSQEVDFEALFKQDAYTGWT